MKTTAVRISFNSEFAGFAIVQSIMDMLRLGVGDNASTMYISEKRDED
jgi:hypothetical protein